jgi:membrane associated rhomboid family serine protease
MNIIQDLKQQYKIGDISFRIIIWNVLCFLIAIPFFYQFQIGVFDYPNWVSLSSKTSGFLFKPWTFFTYQFFHSGFFHLFFNMLTLSFSSYLFLTFFTQKQLLAVYILGGVFAGVLFVLGFNVLNDFGNIVGASASIMSVLVAVTTYQPLMDVRIPLIGYVRLWYITITIIIVSDVLQFSLSNTGGHIAHLGGALFGFIYIKALQSGTDLGNGLNLILDKISTLFSPRTTSPFKKVHRNVTTKTSSSGSRIVTKDKSQQQIDEILDKISQSGYDSLTKDEKEFLFKAGK